MRRRQRWLFFEETWRQHPAIGAYTSKLFYDGKHRSKDGLEKQVIKGSGPISGSGPYFLTVEHNGNQNCSPRGALMGRSESVAPVNFASKSKDLQVCQRAMLDAFQLHALSKRDGEHYSQQ